VAQWPRVQQYTWLTVSCVHSNYTWPLCHVYYSTAANCTIRNNRIYHASNTWLFTRSQLFATCTTSVHVATCKWQIAIFFCSDTTHCYSHILAGTSRCPITLRDISASLYYNEYLGARTPALLRLVLIFGTLNSCLVQGRRDITFGSLIIIIIIIIKISCFMMALPKAMFFFSPPLQKMLGFTAWL
jgi:hypothetical protein